MKLKKALEIVLSLAIDNALELEYANSEKLKKEYFKQSEAIEIVTKLKELI